MGVKSKTIHSLSQALGTGVVFLELQLKEYTASLTLPLRGTREPLLNRVLIIIMSNTISYPWITSVQILLLLSQLNYKFKNGVTYHILGVKCKVILNNYG